MTVTTRIKDGICGNRLYIKREDLFPLVFGGNKARKAELFFDEVDALHADCVVTYGGASSNHCRVVAGMASMRRLPCFIVSSLEQERETKNRALTRIFSAQIRLCPVAEVKKTIDDLLHSLKKEGRNPYFIPGGGHGNIGTQAYVNCYEEVLAYERAKGFRFDYMFLASGTGTTQAGLICGAMLRKDERKIIGISIARPKPYGETIVQRSVRDYMKAFAPDTVNEASISDMTVFIDDYTAGGYGKSNAAIENTIRKYLLSDCIPLDPSYTGKAMWGMQGYLEKQRITKKNLLFLHTGGLPLFFDTLGAEDVK